MKKILSLHKLYFSVLFFLVTVTVQLIIAHQTFASAHLIWHPAGVNTNWSNANNWRISTYSGTTASNAPLAADTAEIGPNNSNFTVVLDVDTAVAVLIISGTGQIFLNTSTNKTLRVSGNIFSTNTNTVGGGTCTIKLIGSSSSLNGNTSSTNKGKLPNLIIAKTSGTTLTLNNYITLGGSTKLKYVSGIIDATSSTVGFYLSNTIVGNFTLFNAEFIGSSSSVIDSNTLTLNGDFIYSGSSYAQINYGTIELYGNIINTCSSTAENHGTAKIVMLGTANQTYSYSGSTVGGRICNWEINKSSGSVTPLSGTTVFAANSLKITSGDFTAPSGILSLKLHYGYTSNTTVFNHAGGSFSHNNGTVSFDCLGNSTIFVVDVLSTTHFYNVVCNILYENHQPGLTTASGDTMKVDNDFTHTDGFFNGKAEVKGNLIVNSGADEGTGKIILDGSTSTNYSYGSSGRTCFIEINKSGSNSVSVQSGTTGLSVSGLFIIAGTFNAPTGTLNIGGVYDFGTSKTIFNQTGGAFIHNNGTVEFNQKGNGTTFTVDVSTSTQFYNLKLNNTPTNSNAILIGGTGDTLKAANDLTYTDGIFNGIAEVKGNLIVNSSADEGTGKIILDGSSSTNYSYGSSGRTCFIEINKSGSNSVSPQSGTTALSVSGLFLVAGTFNAPTGTLNIGGVYDFGTSKTIFNQTGGAFVHNNGTVEFNQKGNGTTYTVDVSTSTQFYNLKLNNTPTNSNAILCGGTGDTLKVANDLTLTDGIVNTTPMTVQGNVTVASTFDGGTAPLIFTGGNSQNFDLTGATGLFNGNIYINKSANNVTLQSACTLDAASQSLTFVSGNIISTATNLLTICDNVTVTGASNSSFVKGPVKKIGNDGFKFPIGKGSSYKPDSISAPSTTSDAFTSEYFDAASATTNFNSPLTYLNPCEYWNITHTSGSATVNAKLYFDAPCFHIASLSYLNIARDSSSRWVKALGTFTTTGNTTSGTIISSTARSNWGDITLAKTNALVVANAGSDAIICAGSSAAIGGAPTGSGGTGTKTYSWSPSAGLSSSTGANPVASPSVNTTYIVNVTDNISEFDIDTVVIASSPVVFAGYDKTLCPGGDTYLGSSPTAEGGTGTLTYSWSPSTGLDTTYIANPHCTTTVTTTYTLTVTDANSCSASDNDTITISTLVVAHAGNDTTVTRYSPVHLETTVTATGGSGTYSFMWAPQAYLDSAGAARPIAKLPHSETFTLEVEDENGCTDDDAITVTISNPLPVIDADLGGIPFIENKGQVIDTSGSSISDIKFKSSLHHSDLYVRDTMLTVVYAHGDTVAATVDTLYLMNILFDGANTNTMTAVAGDTMDTRVNYYLGYLPGYYTDLRTTRYIQYNNLYNGIDVNLYNTVGNMNWHFTADTTANPADISMFFDGADSVVTDTSGNVNVFNPFSMFSWRAPLATQTISGRIDTLSCSYTITGKHVSINIGSYNVHHAVDVYFNHSGNNIVRSQPDGIFMDWSTFFGGAGIDVSTCVSRNNNLIAMGGNTQFFSLPPAPNSGPYTSVFGDDDIFVTLFNVNQRKYTWLTYYGGQYQDYAKDIVIGPQNRTYICGSTGSDDFPLVPLASAYNVTLAQTYTNDGDGFVICFNDGAGGLLIPKWATYLKGRSASSLAIDYTLNIRGLLVAGSANDNGGGTLNFDPTPFGSSYFASNQGGEDGTIMQFIISGANFGHLNWATYLGGSGTDYLTGICTNQYGALAVTGITSSTNLLPIINGSFAQPTYGGGVNDAYLAYFATGRHLTFSTYIGGDNTEDVSGLGSFGGNPSPCNVGFYPSDGISPLTIAAGATRSGSPGAGAFPVTAYGQSFSNSAPYYYPDAYISVYRFNSKVFATCIGGSSYEFNAKIVTSPHVFYLAGSTSGFGFPTVDFYTTTSHSAFYDYSFNGGIADGFIMRFKVDDTTIPPILQWSTFIGGQQEDLIFDVCVNDHFPYPTSSNDLLFAVGYTQSTGAIINSSGQPVGSDFPLCDFANGTQDYLQSILGGGVIDGFIMSFVDACGGSCYRVEDEEEIKTEIKKVTHEELSVFPNPAEDYCYLLFNSPDTDEAQLFLYNFTGQTVYSAKIFSGVKQKINLNQLPAGIYLVRAGNKTQKIIKQ